MKPKARKHIEVARTKERLAEVRIYDADTGDLLDIMHVPTALQEVVTPAIPGKRAA